MEGLSEFELVVLRFVIEVESRQRAKDPTDGGAHQTDVCDLAITNGYMIVTGVNRDYYRRLTRVRRALDSLARKGVLKLMETPLGQALHTFTVVSPDVVTMVGHLGR